MKLIISENQVKKLLDNFVLEQNVNIGRGGTDLRTVSHAYLTKNHGLPKGSNHENYYYSADIKKVIEQSGVGNIKNYLSVFNPLSPYSDKPGAYYDYVNVNGEELTQEDIKNVSSKTFRFTEGTITAAHNGLLGIARAMESLKGTPGILTLQFGTHTSGEDARSERLSQGVKYQSTKTLDKTPTILGILSLLAMAAVKPEYRQFTASQGYTAKFIDDDSFINQIRNFINAAIIGANGFFDVNVIPVETVVSTLTPKGFITQTEFDIKPLFDSLKSLRNEEDKIKGAFDTPFENRKDYNKNKFNKIVPISNQFVPGLIEDMKQKYIHNLKIFVAHYLPEAKNEILNNIESKVIFPNLNIATQHQKEFTSKGAPGTSDGGKLETSGRTY